MMTQQDLARGAKNNVTLPATALEPLWLGVGGLLNFEELRKTDPYWLPVHIRFDAPAELNTRRIFTSEDLDRDLIIVGAVTDLYDPYAVDTPTRNVPKLLVNMRATDTDWDFSRKQMPLWAFAGTVYQQAPYFWQRAFALRKLTKIELDVQVERSPTPTAQPAQGIEGDIIFHCIRLNRTV